MNKVALSAALEILKPITWFAPMWAFMCGVVSSGQPADGRWWLIAGGVALSGPLVCGTSQAVNDWYDRHVDAINEPHRPIPSGRLPGKSGYWIAFGATILSLIVAAFLGVTVLVIAIVALAAAWAYSAPPLRLKSNGWYGNSAVGLCYEGLPWFTGAAVMTGAFPDWRIVLVALLYSAGAHGIMTLNDFKSVEGDLKLGLASLPAQLGVDRAARLACWVMALPQIAVILALIGWDKPWHALIVAGLLVGQFALMPTLLREPRAKAAWYNATGTTLYVLGMLVTAIALGSGVQP
ncbi:MAG: chlorophyll synthase ChlG [Beijerinckiaceae bacterium]